MQSVIAELQATLEQWLLQTCPHQLLQFKRVAAAASNSVEKFHFKFRDENHQDYLFAVTADVCKLEMMSSSWV